MLYQRFTPFYYVNIREYIIFGSYQTPLFQELRDVGGLCNENLTHTFNMPTLCFSTLFKTRFLTYIPETIKQYHYIFVLTIAMSKKEQQLWSIVSVKHDTFICSHVTWVFVITWVSMKFSDFVDIVHSQLSGSVKVWRVKHYSSSWFIYIFFYNLFQICSFRNDRNSRLKIISLIVGWNVWNKVQ